MALITVTKDFNGESISVSQKAGNAAQAVQLGIELSQMVDAIIDRRTQEVANVLERQKPKGYPAPVTLLVAKEKGVGHA